ncbi:hypothetical protein [Streptomyces mirabilis]|uniref:hypothetical protein n=1 Tax=Streptomyces mirabilis TaxID=68239 RepID=UPI003664526C
MNLPEDMDAFVKAKGNVSSHTARILRRQNFAEEWEVRADAGRGRNRDHSLGTR